MNSATINSTQLELAYAAAEKALSGTSSDIGVGELDKVVHAVLEAVLPSIPASRGAETEGWVLVPKEPTEAMLEAADRARALPEIYTREQWAAMLAALPAPHPVGEQEPVADSPTVVMGYTNWRGEYAEREIVPMRPWFGSTDWHPEPQWLLKAWDVQKDAERDFAIKDIGFASEGMVSRAEVNRILQGAFGAQTADLLVQIIYMKSALKPFAEASECFDKAAAEMGFAPNFDEYKPKTAFTHGQLRAARTALAAALVKP